MFNPPALRGARTDINIPTRTLIVQSCFGQINLLDSVKPKQASINAFFMFSCLTSVGDAPFFTLPAAAVSLFNLFQYRFRVCSHKGDR